MSVVAWDGQAWEMNYTEHYIDSIKEHNKYSENKIFM